MELRLKQASLSTASTDDFYYDLFLGGYFKPEKFLDEESAKKVKEAINIINQYENLLVENELIEEM